MGKEQLLNWYKLMGADELITDAPRNYLDNNKKSIKKEITSFSKIITDLKDDLDSCKTIDELKAKVMQIDNLSIKKTATHTVFADGNPQAKVMLIGEAPGENEDLLGIPFCGQSGKLLDHILEHIGLTRIKNLYITNSVFWRPPGNRRPTPEENAICLPFVEKHIALINPDLIIFCGSTAASTMLNSTQSVTNLRKVTHNYTNRYLNRSIPARVIFHPSYLLRQPTQKKTMWFDLLDIVNEFPGLVTLQC